MIQEALDAYYALGLHLLSPIVAVPGTLAGFSVLVAAAAPVARQPCNSKFRWCCVGDAVGSTVACSVVAPFLRVALVIVMPPARLLLPPLRCVLLLRFLRLMLLSVAMFTQWRSQSQVRFLPPLTLSFGSASFFDVSAGATTATRTLVGDAASLATGRMLLSRTVAVTLGAIIVVAAAIPLMMLWFTS